MPYQYRKTAYELVKEASHELGKNGKSFHYSEVIDYIRTRYPDCPFKDNTFILHLRGLSKNIESSKKNHPSLYKRAFLIYLGNGQFKLAELNDSCEIERVESKVTDSERIAKDVMEKHFGVKLEKKRLNIFGKYKEFDLVNVEHAIVGDVKFYQFKGTPSAQFSTLSEYVWLMEKLEQFTGRKWRKFIVGLGSRETFERYAKIYNPWLGDVEIYFINDDRKLEILRSPVLGI